MLTQVLPVAIGQRYSVLVHFNQTPGTYYFRASALATGDMVQIIQGQALIAYGNEVITLAIVGSLVVFNFPRHGDAAK
jgi:Multicopper oxidase